MPYNQDLYDWTKKFQGKHISPLRSIKEYCKLQCSCNDRETWVNCAFTACLLWKYRIGKGIRHQRNKQASKLHYSNKQEPGEIQERLV